MAERNTEYILHEAARDGIVALAGVMSSSLTIAGKRTRLLRIIDDLTQAAEQAQEEE